MKEEDIKTLNALLAFHWRVRDYARWLESFDPDRASFFFAVSTDTYFELECLEADIMRQLTDDELDAYTLRKAAAIWRDRALTSHVAAATLDVVVVSRSLDRLADALVSPHKTFAIPSVWTNADPRDSVSPAFYKRPLVRRSPTGDEPGIMEDDEDGRIHVTLPSEGTTVWIGEEDEWPRDYFWTRLPDVEEPDDED